MLRNKLYIVLWSWWIITHAQGQVNDMRLWNRLTVEKNLSRHWSLESMVGTRLGQNISALEIFYIEGGVNYTYNKHWGAEFHYRYSSKTDFTDRYEIRHRAQIKLSYDTKWRKIITKYYLQFQKQFTDVNRSEDWVNPGNYIRGQFTLSYDTDRKWKPYAAVEIFHQIKYDRQEFNRVRYEMGLKYKLNKHNTIQPFYMIQREFNESNPMHSYIIGFNYKLEI